MLGRNHTSTSIGVVSDTHGHVSFTLNAVRVLEGFCLERIIHCGDIGSTSIPGLFSQWPTHYVLGNVDHLSEDLNLALRAAGATLHGRFGHLEIMGRSIAFLHGDDIQLLRKEATSGKWDLLCHGHSHVAKQQLVGNTLVLNPGALYRTRQHTIAIVKLPQLEVTSLTV